jgi:hypothetical protein
LPTEENNQLKEMKLLNFIPPNLRKFFSSYQWSLIAFFSVLLLYFIAFSTLPKSVFWSPDEGAKFLDLHTLLNRRGESIYQVPYPGQRLDPDYVFYPGASAQSAFPQPLADGQVDFSWSIWFPLISVIPFKLLGAPGLYVIPLVSGLMIVALSGWLTHRFMPAATPLVIVMVGLGSPIFFYALLFWEHTLATLLGLVALWQAIRAYELGGWRRWFALLLTGFLLVGAIALRSEMLAYAVALSIGGTLGLIMHQRRYFQSRAIFRNPYELLTIMVVGLILFALFAGLNNAFDFLIGRGWVGPRFGKDIGSVLSRLQETSFWYNFFSSYLLEMWINAPWSSHLAPVLPLWLAWLSLVGVILSGLIIFTPLPVQSRFLMATSLLIGSVSIYALFLPQPYRSIHSLFLPAPYLVLAILMWGYARQQKCFPVTLLTSTTVLYLILGTVATAIKQGGKELALEWGARYMLIIYPLLSICAVVGMYHFYRTVTTSKLKYLLLGLSLILLFVGIQYQIRGIREIQTTKNSLVAQATVMETIYQPIVTDLWWLSSALATRFVEQEMYTLSQREELYRWLDLARGQINSFVFVSLGPLDDDFIQAAPYPIRPTQEQVVHNLTFTEFEIFTPVASQ